MVHAKRDRQTRRKWAREHFLFVYSLVYMSCSLFFLSLVEHFASIAENLWMCVCDKRPNDILFDRSKVGKVFFSNVSLFVCTSSFPSKWLKHQASNGGCEMNTPNEKTTITTMNQSNNCTIFIISEMENNKSRGNMHQLYIKMKNFQPNNYLTILMLISIYIQAMISTYHKMKFSFWKLFHRF